MRSRLMVIREILERFISFKICLHPTKFLDGLVVVISACHVQARRGERNEGAGRKSGGDERAFIPYHSTGLADWGDSDTPCRDTGRR